MMLKVSQNTNWCLFNSKGTFAKAHTGVWKCFSKQVKKKLVASQFTHAFESAFQSALGWKNIKIIDDAENIKKHL